MDSTGPASAPGTIADGRGEVDPGSGRSSRITHIDLMGWAADLQQAALLHDVDAVHEKVAALRDQLVAHLDREAGTLDDLSSAAAGTIRSGQRRLLGQIDALVARSMHGGDDCRCIEGTARLTAALRRQGRLESGLRKR